MILLTVSLCFGLSTSVFAAIDEERAEGLQLIEQANLEIEEMIEQAVAEANELKKNYSLELEKVDVKIESTNDDKRVAKLNKEKAKLTTKYNEELDAIIKGVYDETLQLSKKTIKEAAKYGIIAECSWVEVTFADRTVMIDPIKVVGEN
jgi:thiamine biosynthesis lipoprotein ApbE